MLSLLRAGTVLALCLGSTWATVQYAGVNIAGFDFGCVTDGTCTVSNAYGPVAAQGGPDGIGQMEHFTKAYGFNMFRLPVGWQYLVNDKLGGPLDGTNFGNYDALMQGCLKTGAHCIIDIHNYARWNGKIIGQGGPSDDDFASLWGQLAQKYAKEDNVVFGIMNEPHDLPDIDRWGMSVQAAITAIRKAGATTQMALLPGTGYTSAAEFVSSGSGTALAKVTNIDGSTTNLIFDVHKYLDSDNSGTHAGCVTDQIKASFSPLADWLTTVKRQALISETGGGKNDDSCMNYLCAMLDFVNANSGVYLGFLGWAAGSFATDYVLSLTPSGSAQDGWTDQKLLTQCFSTKFEVKSLPPGPDKQPAPQPGPPPPSPPPTAPPPAPASPLPTPPSSAAPDSSPPSPAPDPPASAAPAPSPPPPPPAESPPPPSSPSCPDMTPPASPAPAQLDRSLNSSPQPAPARPAPSQANIPSPITNSSNVDTLLALSPSTSISSAGAPHRLPQVITPPLSLNQPSKSSNHLTSNYPLPASNGVSSQKRHEPDKAGKQYMSQPSGFVTVVRAIRARV